MFHNLNRLVNIRVNIIVNNKVNIIVNKKVLKPADEHQFRYVQCN